MILQSQLPSSSKQDAGFFLPPFFRKKQCSFCFPILVQIEQDMHEAWILDLSHLEDVLQYKRAIENQLSAVSPLNFSLSAFSNQKYKSSQFLFFTHFLLHYAFSLLLLVQPLVTSHCIQLSLSFEFSSDLVVCANTKQSYLVRSYCVWLSRASIWPIFNLADSSVCEWFNFEGNYGVAFLHHMHHAFWNLLKLRSSGLQCSSLSEFGGRKSLTAAFLFFACPFSVRLYVLIFPNPM